MDLKGKVAVVTGGAQGIGRSYCAILLRKGMKVCMCDIKEKPSEFIDNLPSDCKDNIIFQKCDVSSVNDLKHVFDKVLQTFGRIDLVVNNAGIVNEENWKKVIEVNFVGVINGIQLGFQYMGLDKGGSGGYIVNTGSNMSFDPFPTCPIYCGTKHAVAGLTKSYGSDYHFQKTGVKVGCVCPGPTNTDLVKATPGFSLDPEESKNLIASVQFVSPDETAKGLVKLLEDGKNGALLLVDANGTRYIN